MIWPGLSSRLFVVRYRTIRGNADRVCNREPFVASLSAAIQTRSRDDLLAALEGAGVPAGPINTVAQVFADPQVVARALRLDLPAAGAIGGNAPSVRSPMRRRPPRRASVSTRTPSCANWASLKRTSAHCARRARPARPGRSAEENAVKTAACARLRTFECNGKKGVPPEQGTRERVDCSSLRRQLAGDLPCKILLLTVAILLSTAL